MKVTSLVISSSPVFTLLVNSVLVVSSGSTVTSRLLAVTSTMFAGSVPVSSVTVYLPGTTPVMVWVLLSPFSISIVRLMVSGSM